MMDILIEDIDLPSTYIQPFLFMMETMKEQISECKLSAEETAEKLHSRPDKMVERLANEVQASEDTKKFMSAHFTKSTIKRPKKAAPGGRYQPLSNRH